MTRLLAAAMTLVVLAALGLLLVLLWHAAFTPPTDGVVLGPATSDTRPAPPATPPATTTTTSVPPPATTVPPVARTAPTMPAAAGPQTGRDDAIFDRLAACESGGRWHLVNPPYEGGLQFMPSTWAAYREAGMPVHAAQATREQQIAVARRVLAAQGPGAWPVCGPRVGLTAHS